MTDTKSNDVKKVFDIAYKIYHFVAKVFLYSILIILILVAVGFSAYVIDLVKNIKSGETKPPLLGAYVIISPSMVPTIKVEDAIIILRQEPEQLKVGDIITFNSSDPRYSGLTITHRIVGIEKSNDGNLLFRTKGDNNNTEDTSLVSTDNIYGRVILKIPKIGYIQYILTQSYGWLLLVVIPCLGIVIYDIIKLVKSIRKNINPTKHVTIDKATPNIELIGEDIKVLENNSNNDNNNDDKNNKTLDLKENNDDDIEVI